MSHYFNSFLLLGTTLNTNFLMMSLERYAMVCVE